jgi:hypothetical protein
MLDFFCEGGKEIVCILTDEEKARSMCKNYEKTNFSPTLIYEKFSLDDYSRVMNEFKYHFKSLSG